MIETERRFLIKKLPTELMEDFEEIEDCMILTGELHPHLRLRRSGNEYELTKKYPVKEIDKLQMVEETIELTRVEYETLKQIPYTGQIKRRYKFVFENQRAESDIWLGDLKGLAVIEFEFPSEEVAEKYLMPDFCLREVTQEEWLAGGMLSGKKYADIERRLKRLGYIPISV